MIATVELTIDRYVALYGAKFETLADHALWHFQDNPTRTHTASTLAKVIKTDSWTARKVLDMLTETGDLTDQAGRGGAWTRWALLVTR